MSGKLNRLKRAIQGKLKNISKLQIKCSTIYPMLIFSYYSHGLYYYKTLRNIIAEVPSIKSVRNLIDDILGRIYERVD